LLRCGQQNLEEIRRQDVESQGGQCCGENEKRRRGGISGRNSPVEISPSNWCSPMGLEAMERAVVFYYRKTYTLISN
jgi:hypothetical protein